MDYVSSVTIPRIKAVLDKESFVYLELADANAEYVSAISKAKTSGELLTIWKSMRNDAFLSYRVDPSLFDADLNSFKSLSVKEQKRLLTLVLDKNMLYVPLDDMEDKRYGLTASDKALTKKFFESKVAP